MGLSTEEKQMIRLLLGILILCLLTQEVLTQGDMNPNKPSPQQRNTTNSTSRKVIVTAVGVTAAVTFVFSGLLFCCYQKLVVSKGKEKEKKDERPLLGISISGSPQNSDESLILHLNSLGFSGDGFRDDVFNKKPSYSGEQVLRRYHSLSFASYVRNNRESSEVYPLPSLLSRTDSPLESSKLLPPPILARSLAEAPPRANPNSSPPPPPPPPPFVSNPHPPPPPPKGTRSALPPIAPKVLGTSSRTGNSGPGKSADKSNTIGKDDGNLRAKLKPLHWDKVSANLDHSMVWDKLTEGSFRLDEQMIESLFGYIPNKIAKDEITKSQVDVPQPRDNEQILDPRKSQNIAILLRALNVTREEVCDALLEGDGLSTELLEKLIKITLTVEEERKLKDYKSDVSKLGPAERFLKPLLDIPFAFKRFDAMLFRATFEEEISFMKISFKILEDACTELKGSRLFFKLLEAVLKTGNRMNAGTFRGDAQAFNLNTLLKLADVKGKDGQTTLLHFVVQEMIRSEGMKELSKEDDTSSLGKEEEEEDDDHIRLGIKAVGGLSNELFNVKKAASIDPDALVTCVSKLASGLGKLTQFLSKDMTLNSKDMGMCISFQKSMESFVLQAREKISEIQREESRVFFLVKKITLYFHADAAEEKSQLLRIFYIVRDFLGMLDHVCTEIGRTHKTKKNTSKLVVKELASPPPPVLLHNHILWQSSFLNSLQTRYDSSSDDESVMST